MLIEAIQAAAEAARNGGITVAIPTGVIASIATVVFIKGADYLMGRKKGRNGGPKPGEGKTCETHGKEIDTAKGDIIKLQTQQETTDKLLGEVRDDVKEILRRLPKA